MDPKDQADQRREDELDRELENLDVRSEDADNVSGGGPGIDPCDGGEVTSKRTR